jgi:tetratricopeptide (TPR) repeat protein
VKTLTDAELEWAERIRKVIYSDNQPEQAVIRLNIIIRENPSNARAWSLKANALNRIANQRKEWQYSREALQCAERAIGLDPQDELAHTNKAWALIDLGHIEDGLRAAEHALELNSRNVYAWFNKAWALYLSGEKQAALNACERALELEPGNAIVQKGYDTLLNDEIPEHLKKFVRHQARGNSA